MSFCVSVGSSVSAGLGQINSRGTIQPKLFFLCAPCAPLALLRIRPSCEALHFIWMG